MTALIVIGAVLLLLLLLLLAPVRLRAEYRAGQVRLYLYLLFFRLNLSPDRLMEKLERAEEKRARKKTKKPKKKKEPAEKPPQKRSARETVEAVWQLVLASKRPLRRICKGLTFYKVRLFVAVGGEDAHKTAMACGGYRTAAALLLAIVGELFTLKKPTVRIAPNFTRQANAYDLSLRVRIIPLTLLISGVQLGMIFLDQTKQTKKKKRVVPQKTRKGGRVHESATASHR